MEKKLNISLSVNNADLKKGLASSSGIIASSMKSISSTAKRNMGGLSSTIQESVGGSEALGGSLGRIASALSRSPYGAAAVAVGTLAMATAKYFGILQDGLSVQQQVNKTIKDATNEASDAAKKESSRALAFISIAKDENASRELRNDAIKELNKISPEYLGNLNLENISTDKATTAIDLYTASVLKNARAKSFVAKLEKEYLSFNDLELAKRNLEKDLASAQEFQKTIVLTTTYRGKEIKDKTKEQGLKTQIANIEIELAKVVKPYEIAKAKIDAIKNEIAQGGVLPTTPTKKAKQPKQPKDTKIEEDVLRLKSRGLFVKKTARELENTLEMLPDIRPRIVLNPYVNKIDISGIKVALIQIGETTKQELETVLSSALSGIGDALGTTIADSITGMDTDPMAAIGDIILNSLAMLAKQIGTALIALSVPLMLAGVPLGFQYATAGLLLTAAGSTVSGLMKNKNTSQTTPVTDGGGSVGTLKFAEGGIVGGAMYSGDKVQAMVNSSEMILNGRQQSNLFNMIKSGVSGSGGGGVLSHRISGNDLLIIMDRASKTRGRTI